MALIRPLPTSGLKRVSGSFTSISGTSTTTVSSLSEIKYIAVFQSGQTATAATAIDLTGDTPYCVASGTYLTSGFANSASAVNGNTFSWTWSGAVNFDYVAYGN